VVVKSQVVGRSIVSVASKNYTENIYTFSIITVTRPEPVSFPYLLFREKFYKLLIHIGLVDYEE
jgi:hypothetical protein